MTFSIIIPVYNVAPYLRECLDSVLAQTYIDWEAICVDDGSNDGSGGILEEYAKKDARFKVVHQKNCGVSVARNNGLKLSGGDYIGFLDPDDYIVGDWLERVMSVLKSEPVDMVRMNYTDWRGESISEIEAKIKYVNQCKVTKFDGVMARAWGWETFFYGGWSWIVFFKRVLIQGVDNVFPIGMRIREDNIAMVRVAMLIETSIQCDYPGYLYRWRESSAWRTSHTGLDSARFFSECLTIWDCFSNKITQEGWETVARSALSKAVAKEWLFWDWNGRRSLHPAYWQIASALSKLIRSEAMDFSVFDFRGRVLLKSAIITHGAIIVWLYYLLQSAYRRVRYG